MIKLGEYVRENIMCACIDTTAQRVTKKYDWTYGKTIMFDSSFLKLIRNVRDLLVVVDIDIDLLILPTPARVANPYHQEPPQ